MADALLVGDEAVISEGEDSYATVTAGTPQFPG